MFHYLRELYRRHRTKVIFATGFAAFSYLIGIYVKNKISEFQNQLREENATRTLIKKRFLQTQKDCYMTFLSFLPVLIEPIFKELDVEEVTKSLKLIRRNKNLINDGKSEINSEDLTSSTSTSAAVDIAVNEDVKKAVKSKVELWQELKIKSLTRFLTLIYSETLLIILLHLQLNIISRKSYLKTALKLASKNQGIKLIDLENDDDNNDNNLLDKDLPEQAFLSFTWWFLNKGSMKLKDIINKSVEEVFDEITLREELSMEQFSNLILEVQKNVDSKLFEKNVIISLALPPKEEEFELLQNTNTTEFLTSFNHNVNNMQTLQKMNTELQEYLESEQVSQLVKGISTIGISSILSNVDHNLHLKQELKNEIATDTSESASATTKWKLVFILAVLTPQANELASRRIDNNILYTMNNVGELDELSASVYSNFDL